MGERAFYRTMVRKYHTFRNDPIGSTSAKLAKWFGYSPDTISDRVYYRMILRMRHKESYNIICDIRKGQGIFMSYYKYIHLYSLLDNFRPKKILEFGSGSSTGILAAYAQKFNARVVTVEDNQAWLENTRRALGDLSNRVDFVLSSAMGENGNPNRCYYRYTPNEIFDFVYVDGPPLVINGQHDASAVNWNIVEMINHGLSPQIIAIDIRLATANYIAINFPSDYEAHLLERNNGHFGYRYHSFFVKRKTS